MQLKTDESLWRSASSRADYLTVSCDLKLAFSSLVTHSQKSSKRDSPQESFPGFSRIQEYRKECTGLQSLQCKEPSLTKECDMEGNNKALGAVVVQRNLWHTCVNTSLTSVCFVTKVHMFNDLIGCCLVCASGPVMLLSHCNFECKTTREVWWSLIFCSTCSSHSISRRVCWVLFLPWFCSRRSGYTQGYWVVLIRRVGVG